MKGKEDFTRILLIRRKALGDSLVTMRAVLEVVRAWPTAAIDLVIDRPFSGLMEGLAGGADRSGRLRVVTWPPSGQTSWLRTLRSGDYQLVIDWLGSPRTALWTILTGAAVRVGYDLPRRRWAYNVRVPRNEEKGSALRGFAGEAFLDPLRCLGVVPPPWRGGFAAEGMVDNGTGDVGGIFQTWLERWCHSPGLRVVMMMSATWSAKGWPTHQSVALFRAFRERGYEPVFVMGPGDEKQEAVLREHLPEDAFAPPTNLPELAHLLGKARIFVGTDCGPRHLAASLGVPTVTLFGPTDPIGWNPAAPEHVSVRTGVDCSPCDLTECPIPGHPCMENIAPGLVLDAVDRVLGPDPN